MQELAAISRKRRLCVFWIEPKKMDWFCSLLIQSMRQLSVVVVGTAVDF
jgi:hypothetical protein